MDSVAALVVSAVVIACSLVVSRRLWGPSPSRGRVLLSTWAGIAAGMVGVMVVLTLMRAPYDSAVMTALGVFTIATAVWTARSGLERLLRARS